MGILKTLGALPGAELVKPLVYYGMDKAGVSIKAGKPLTSRGLSGSYRTSVGTGRNLLAIDPPMEPPPGRIPGSAPINYPQQPPVQHHAPAYRTGEFAGTAGVQFANQRPPMFMGEAEAHRRRMDEKYRMYLAGAAAIGAAAAGGAFAQRTANYVPDPVQRRSSAPKRRPEDESSDARSGGRKWPSRLVIPRWGAPPPAPYSVSQQNSRRRRRRRYLRR